MNWYKYRQNNSGGSFDYDESNGISVNVWIEAANAKQADERASYVGVYFDDSMDCSCCGSRWDEKFNSWNDDEESELPPEPEETIKVDEFEKWSSTKWMNDGQYETFVHPISGPFYGAQATSETVRALTYGGSNGYGVSVGSDYVIDKPVALNELGWDENGNYHAPAPGYQYYRPTDDNKFYIGDSDMCIEHVVSYGHARVWCPTEKLALEVINSINKYLDVTPRPKTVEKLIELYGSKSIVPEVIPVFEEDC